MFFYQCYANLSFTEKGCPGFQRVFFSINRAVWLSRSNLAQVKVAANLCLILIVPVGGSEIPKIWIWPGVRLSFINFVSYPLEQHCHLNDMTGDYSCEKTKRQPLLMLQDWRCILFFCYCPISSLCSHMCNSTYNTSTWFWYLMGSSVRRN